MLAGRAEEVGAKGTKAEVGWQVVWAGRNCKEKRRTKRKSGKETNKRKSKTKPARGGEQGRSLAGRSRCRDIRELQIWV